MRNLLKANFSRLFQSKIFYLAVIAMAGLAAFVCWSQWDDARKFSYVITMDSALFNAQVVFGIAAAILVSLFVGVEYSDGTIRNKLLVGRKRIHIYLANFITCGAALAIVYGASTAVALGFGTLLLEPSVVPAKHLLIAFGMGFSPVLAYAAIYNFIAMLFSNRTYTAIAAIMLAFGLMICATYVQNRLDQPEFIQKLAPQAATSAAGDTVAETVGIDAHTENVEFALAMNEDGEISQMAMETVPNPQYLSGAERERFQFFFDVNPAGQTVELAMLNIPHPVRVALLDVGIMVIFGLGGIWLFRKKDIK